MQEATLKLIQVVKEYPLLYDLSHADSKNKSLKDRQWIEVGKRLNIEGKVAKSKWKGLRDCYMKHLRALRTPDQLDPFTKRYLTWTWSEQMSFIKATLDSKQTTSKVSQIDARNDYENEDDSTILVFEDDPLNSNELTVKSKVPVSDHDNDLPIIETSFSMKKQNSKSKKRKIVPKGNFRNPLSESEIDDDKNFRNSVIDFDSNPVIDNFRNPLSVPEIDDDIDLMFKSFAKTVKSLSPNRRIFLKAKLAKLIFEEELADSKESPVKCFACSRSVPVSDHITDHGMTNDPGKNSSGGQDGYEYYQLP